MKTIKRPDIELLKSASSQITSRITYVYFLVSFLYSTRKNIELCQNNLRFLTILLQNDLVKIDFLITKAGLLQVIFNLLRYFSEFEGHIKTETSETDSLPIINDLKHFFLIITRILLRFNENQDENLTFYLNSLISLSYDTANTGYERLNHNIKSLVLNIVQSILDDLNTSIFLKI